MRGRETSAEIGAFEAQQAQSFGQSIARLFQPSGISMLDHRHYCVIRTVSAPYCSLSAMTLVGGFIWLVN